MNSRSLLGMILFLVLVRPDGFAANSTWTGTSGGAWSNAGNWSAGLPTIGDIATFGNDPADAPISVDVDSTQSLSRMLFTNTSNRSYSFSGTTISLVNDGATTSSISTSTGTSKAAITINNDLYIGNTSGTASGTLTIGNVGAGTAGAFSTLTINGNISFQPGNTGASRLTLHSQTTGTILLSGSNNMGTVSFGGTGDLIVANQHALGTGGVQKTTSSTMSLRSNVTVQGTWLQSNGTPYTYLRISEVAMSSADRNLTINDRIAGTTGAIEWVNNINSTGKLILELKYSGGTEQGLSLVTNTSAIVRFSQTGNTTYSGIISGAGQLEKVTGTGTTTLSGANTYTGDTLVSAGTLVLSSTGKLNFLIGDDGVNNQITGTGNVTLDGTFTFDLLGASGGVGDSWTIVDMAGLGTVTYGGTFAVEGFSQNGNLWTSGMYQFDQTDGVLSVVPEPSSALLLLGGIAVSLLGLRRRGRLSA